MANGIYGAGGLEIGRGNVDLINSPVSALLVDSSQYVPDLFNDLSLADIPEAAIIAEVLLVGKAWDLIDVDGVPSVVFRADDAVFNSLSTDEGVEVGAVVLFLDTNELSTSTLLVYLDESPDLPATPDGTDFVLRWDTGDNGIFRWPLMSTLPD